MDTLALLKRPSAFLPVTMSMVALGAVLVFLALYGPAPQPDEGAAALAAMAPVYLLHW